MADDPFATAALDVVADDNIRAAALTTARTPTTCLDNIPGCAVEGFHDHPESLPPDVIAMSEEGFGDA